MISKILEIRRNLGVHKLYVDAANPEIITSLKRALGERTDYEEDLARIKQKHLGNPIYWMNVLPVSFNADGREMLGHTKHLIDRGKVAIHPTKFNKLVVALRTAVATDGLLDKEQTSFDDIFDALRLSLRYYHVQKR
jgi:hypothetical protein